MISKCCRFITLSASVILLSVMKKLTSDCMRNANKSLDILNYTTVREVDKWSRIHIHINGPATWNHLPPELMSPNLSESTFKRALKTHLFLTARRHWDIFMILAPDIDIQTYLLTYLPRKVNKFFWLVGPITAPSFKEIGWLLLQ